MEEALKEDQQEIEFLEKSIVNLTDETGRKVADDFKNNMRIQFDEFLPQWNYVAVPKKSIVPEVIKS